MWEKTVYKTLAFMEVDMIKKDMMDILFKGSYDDSENIVR